MADTLNPVLNDIPDEPLSEDEQLRRERTEACPIRNCPQHPETEMALRCIRSGRLLCMQCAVHTPTGYIAKDVAKAHDDKFYKGTTRDYVITVLVCGIGMLLATGILKYSGMFSALFFISLFVGPLVGTGLTELALRITQRRRGRYSDLAGAASIVVGGFAGSLLALYLRFSSMHAEMAALYADAGLTEELPDLSVAFGDIASQTFTDIWLLVFIGAAAVSAYARFKVRI